MMLVLPKNLNSNNLPSTDVVSEIFAYLLYETEFCTSEKLSIIIESIKATAQYFAEVITPSISALLKLYIEWLLANDILLKSKYLIFSAVKLLAFIYETALCSFSMAYT